MAEEKKVVVLGPPAFASPNPDTMTNSMFEGTTAKRVVGLNDHPVSEPEDDGELKAKDWISEVEAADSQESLDDVANRYSESGKDFKTVVAAIEKKQSELDAEDENPPGDGQ